VLANVIQHKKCLSWPSNRLEEENHPLQNMNRKTPVSKDLFIEATRTSFGNDFLHSIGIMRFSGDSNPENAGGGSAPFAMGKRLRRAMLDTWREHMNELEMEYAVKGE
jgi:hypothetical protein